MKKKLSTNSRVIKDIFAQYRDTFVAFSELINNSIQAEATEIHINIEYGDSNNIFSPFISNIEVIDNGIGVSVSDIDNKLLEIGTNNKVGGKGIGRFAALQIGAKVTIESLAYDRDSGFKSKLSFVLNEHDFDGNSNVSDIDLDIDSEYLANNVANNTYYKVRIDNIYDSVAVNENKKKKLSLDFAFEKIFISLFEKYMLKIFNKEINIYVNDILVDPKLFIDGEPERIVRKYIDNKKDEFEMYFTYSKLKIGEKTDLKVFLTVDNAGIQTVSYGFKFDADWLSPDLGTWIVYVNAEFFQGNIFRDMDLSDIDTDKADLKKFIRNEVASFFKIKNEAFEKFTTRLQEDKYYPSEDIASVAQGVMFDKLAYLVENKYKLIEENNDLREIIFPLINRALVTDGTLPLVSEILKLDDETVEKFNCLLEKTGLEEVIHFSDRVSKRLHQLELLESLVSSKTSKYVKERTQLHKVVEKMLWIFGEEYVDTSTRLLSDKSLKNNLTALRNKLFKFTPSEEDDNFVHIEDNDIRSITDLFLFNEKILDASNREVLIVELKAPGVKISNKELLQAERYAYEIDTLAFFPKINYKIILVSSSISNMTSYKLKGISKPVGKPYFYSQNERKNIEIWVVEWQDIIEINKRKLSYLSTELQLEDVDVSAVLKEDFPEIDFSNVTDKLTKIGV
ncbi:ATP-binding protein [Hymenobacter aerophilus]|uniref:ATP-binding protein n=1 Tax=Hymenobacter aerophilus TaxID=119644 RepID=UPI0008FC0705|nr:ATP-binding protein [Hymenobacter aerophilus]